MGKGDKEREARKNRKQAHEGVDYGETVIGSTKGAGYFHSRELFSGGEMPSYIIDPQQKQYTQPFPNPERCTYGALSMSQDTPGPGMYSTVNHCRQTPPQRPCRGGGSPTEVEKEARVGAVGQTNI